MARRKINLPRVAGWAGRAPFLALALSASVLVAQAPVMPARWNSAQIEQLVRHARAAPADALPMPDLAPLDSAISAKDAAATDRAADALALSLARLHLLGFTPPSARTAWRIADSDSEVDLSAMLAIALAGGGIDAMFAGLDPQHPDYAALKAAYAAETDPARRRTLALNIERWRWLPQSLGADHVLVNTAAFEARLWRGGQVAGRWPVVVGKPSTPSPVFAARIGGVTFNPWWDIPASIVRERGGRFPASQGYVRSGSGWRQRPGPGNALGQMKLVMPNPYNVYLHDTPSKALFGRPVRAFSHGCIRVGDALGFAATLLEGVKSRAEVDATVASRRTETVPLAHAIPVYITYFTAAVGANGVVGVLPDIYGRDGGAGRIADAASDQCPA